LLGSRSPPNVDGKIKSSVCGSLPRPRPGEQFDVTAAVTEELPYLRKRIELAIERAVARG
jgi:hypothetical protein